MLNGHRKLTARDVLRIYRSRWTANPSEVAERYGISCSMVYKIYRRIVWQSVLEHLDPTIGDEIADSDLALGTGEHSDLLNNGTTL